MATTTPRPLLIPIQRALIGGLCFVGLVWFYAWSPASFPLRWFTPEPAGFYHEQTAGFLQGQLHLPRAPDARLITFPDPYDPATNAAYRVNDLSYFKGHYYLYHSPVPSLVLFAPLKIFTGAYLSETGACLIFTLGGAALALGLLAGIRRHLFPHSHPITLLAGAMALTLGQGYQVVLRTGMLNQVPIASAYFFLMLALGALWRALATAWPAPRWLALASLSYGLAIACRPNYVFGGAVLLVPLFVAWHRAGYLFNKSFVLRLLATVGPVIGILAALFSYNYLRFHQPLEFGMRYMLGHWDQRSLPALGFGNFLTNAYHYFIAPVDFHAWFPFITAPSWQATGLLWSAPILLFILLWPLALRATSATASHTALSWGLIVLGAGIANLLTLLFLPSGNSAAIATSANVRYVFDFQPALILAAAVAALGADHYFRTRRRPRRLIIALTLGTALFSAGAALSLDFHRFPPEAYRPLARWLNQPTIWLEHLRGATYGPQELTVKLPTNRPNGYEPLLATGTPEAGSLVYVHYESASTIRLGLVSTSASGPFSSSIPVDYTQPLRIEIHLGSLYPPVSHPILADYTDTQVAALKRRLLIRVDGKTVVDEPAFFPSASPRERYPLAAPFLQDYSTPAFTGEAMAQRILPLPAAEPDPGPPAQGPVALTLHFPAGRGGRIEPLVVTGIPQAGNLLAVAYQDDRAIRFLFDHWGQRGVSTDWLPVDFKQAHTIVVRYGTLLPAAPPAERDRLVVTLDNSVVLDVVQPTYSSAPSDFFVGRNVTGSSVAEYAFTGTIHTVRRLSGPAPAR